jgi:hypothetical protein
MLSLPIARGVLRPDQYSISQYSKNDGRHSVSTAAAGTFAPPAALPTSRASRRFAMHTGLSGRWSDAHIGRPEDQPLVFAVLVVLIAVTLYVFL